VSVEETPTVVTGRIFGRLRANPAGVKEAVFAYAIALVVSSLAVTIVQAGRPGSANRSLAADVVDLTILYVCYLGAAVATYRRCGFGDRITRRGLTEAFGVAIRPVDIPLGIVAGFLAQYVFVPVASLPLVPFVPHLSTRLSSVAKSLTSGFSTPALVVLGLFICLGSPLLEELFFRGVLLRGVAGVRGRRGTVRPRVAVAAALVASILFGLAHFEGLQLLGLIAAGFTFAALAASTGRLGPGFIAHVTFNTFAFVSVVHAF
jgi:membrane protease YdiL (CAAX protease family)